MRIDHAMNHIDRIVSAPVQAPDGIALVRAKIAVNLAMINDEITAVKSKLDRLIYRKRELDESFSIVKALKA
jgi:hypothetical protein